jgi:5'-3' exonuclease
MIQLHQFLTNNITALKNKYKINVILSGYDEDGEGEHKIIKYIKSCNNQKTRNIIYGMDADLIMLSLSCCSGLASKPQGGCQMSSIFLMREKQYKIFELLDINLLRIEISHSMSMHDYIFMCFFLGNDFIPAVTFLKIHNNAINILCDIYNNVKKNKHLDNLVLYNNGGYSINAPFLLAILEVLAGEEANLLYTAETNFQNEQLRYPKQNCSPMERFVINLENIPLNKKQIGFFEKSKNNGTSWRHEYYHELFMNHEESTIKKASYNYIEGFQWTLDYYFNIDKPLDTHYYYKYNYAPCMIDVYKYYLQGEIYLQAENTNTVSPLVQLLMVLPPSSKNLLPLNITSVMTDPSRGLLHCYPSTFKISMYLKRQLWECIPILPDISEDEIIEML